MKIHRDLPRKLAVTFAFVAVVAFQWLAYDVGLALKTIMTAVWVAMCYVMVWWRQ